ncbi:MAG: hypothetical protein QM487_05760, partial [Candidatus Marithrix sp.]
TYLSLGFYIFGKLSSFLSFVYFTSNYSLSPVPKVYTIGNLLVASVGCNEQRELHQLCSNVVG